MINCKEVRVNPSKEKGNKKQYEIDRALRNWNHIKNKKSLFLST